MKARGKRGAGGRGRGGKRNVSPYRRLARRASFGVLAATLFLSALGGWFVSHSRDWLAEKNASWPRIVTAPLYYFGDRATFLTDGLGLTGHDAVYDPDAPAPEGEVYYAGAPRRRAAPAPSDIVVLGRGVFAVGYSPSLRHAVWAAYHIPRDAGYEAGKRPGFRRDLQAPNCPNAGDYLRSGYDRGHLVPNHAIATRFGPEAQERTFAMSNIAPQKPALNRGPWCFIERTAADLWTRAYGELWIIVGTVSRSQDKLPGTNIDVPTAYWQVLLAQTEEGLRALAVFMPRDIAYDAFPVHNIVTIAELEELTGLEFFPEMPEFLKRPLSTDLPTRLWPVRWYDILGLLRLRME